MTGRSLTLAAKRSLGALTAALLLAGCEADFLDRAPLDSITDESFWQTEDQLRLAANGVYAYLKGKNTVDMENMGDNTIWPSITDYRRIQSGQYDFNLGAVNNEWRDDYAGIRRANHFLENYKRANVADARKEAIASEVRFIRVYLYHYLTQLYGDAQFITKTLQPTDPEVYGSREKKEVIVDWMLKELTEIAPRLPLSYPQTEFGRITRGAALALRARIALYNGRWAEAEQAAKQVMDLGVYSLYSNGDPATSYYELFTYKGRASRNPANRETILAHPYLADIFDHNLSREAQVPDQAIRFNPTKSLVDSYLASDGRPISQSPLYRETSYASIFQNRDPRMTQTILEPGSPWKGRMDGRPANDGFFVQPKFRNDRQGAVTVSGYYFTKYIEPSTVGAVSRDENDIILIRYAEVLLTWAEAKLEQGTLSQADLDRSVNLLRARVGMRPMRISELQQWGLSLRDELRRERRVELALEGQRYFDIKRWKQGNLLDGDVLGMKKSLVPRQSDVANQATNADGYIIVASGHVFTDKHYLWPVPLSQLEANPKLGQNPGW